MFPIGVYHITVTALLSALYDYGSLCEHYSSFELILQVNLLCFFNSDSQLLLNNFFISSTSYRQNLHALSYPLYFRYVKTENAKGGPVSVAVRGKFIAAECFPVKSMIATDYFKV